MKGAFRRFVQGPATRWGIRSGHHLVVAIGRTWRVRHVGRESVERARGGGGSVVYVFTHGVLLPLSFTHRNRDVQVLISESRDGEIITHITGNLGYGAVRGSSSRGGAEAVIRMARRAREGHDLAIAPDGPRGPRGSVAPGTVQIATRGRVPIVPVGVASDRAWRARSWDRFLVPKPFARVWVVYGAPIDPSGSRSEGDLGSIVARVEKGMADVEAEAEAYASGRRRAQSALRIPA